MNNEIKYIQNPTYKILHTKSVRYSRVCITFSLVFLVGAMFDIHFVFHTCKSFSIYNSADVFASHNFNVVKVLVPCRHSFIVCNWVSRVKSDRIVNRGRCSTTVSLNTVSIRLHLIKVKVTVRLLTIIQLTTSIAFSRTWPRYQCAVSKRWLTAARSWSWFWRSPTEPLCCSNRWG